MPTPERHIPADMNLAIVADVDARLDAITSDHRVSIAFAIESGSRGWGFPSPDSDYDCRFVYLRPRRDYLALFRKRDVIETPLTPILDVNGWDLGKALKLLLKGNAVIIEWLTSPICYRAMDGFRAEFLALAMDVADRRLIGRHYLNLGREFERRWLPDPDTVPLKKLFYVMRPALALRWLRLRPAANVAPMNFPALVSQSQLDDGAAAEIAQLLAQKAATREMGTGRVPAPIMNMIREELALAEQIERPKDAGAKVEAVAKAEEFFLRTVHALAE